MLIDKIKQFIGSFSGYQFAHQLLPHFTYTVIAMTFLTITLDTGTVFLRLMLRILW